MRKEIKVVISVSPLLTPPRHHQHHHHHHPGGKGLILRVVWDLIKRGGLFNGEGGGGGIQFSETGPYTAFLNNQKILLILHKEQECRVENLKHMKLEAMQPKINNIRTSSTWTIRIGSVCTKCYGRDICRESNFGCDK